MRPPEAQNPKKRDATATQKRLLDAAEDEFARRGFAGARLRDIAASAGVQTTLVHHYFEDKRGLYRAVIERAVVPTQTETWNILRAHADLEGMIRGFVKMLIRFYAQHRNLLAIMRHEALAGSEVLPEILRERLSPLADAVVALVRDMQSRGEIRSGVEPLDVAVLTLSMAVHPFGDPLLDVVLPGATPTDDAALARREDAIATVLLRALRP
jgi:AcrR family transcriptional regulator